MSNVDWNTAEEVTVPQGTFIGWGEIGQTVTGVVVSYGDDAGSDFNGMACPLVVLELTADAVNYRDKGTSREVLGLGELVSVTAGQAGLRRKLMSAGPRPGDIVRIEYSGTYKTGKGEGKEFSVKIARGAGASILAAEEEPF